MNFTESEIGNNLEGENSDLLSSEAPDIERLEGLADIERKIIDSVKEKPKNMWQIHKDIDRNYSTTRRRVQSLAEEGILSVIDTEISSRSRREVDVYGPAHLEKKETGDVLSIPDGEAEFLKMWYGIDGNNSLFSGITFWLDVIACFEQLIGTDDIDFDNCKGCPHFKKCLEEGKEMIGNKFPNFWPFIDPLWELWIIITKNDKKIAEERGDEGKLEKIRKTEQILDQKKNRNIRPALFARYIPQSIRLLVKIKWEKFKTAKKAIEEEDIGLKEKPIT